MTNDKEQESLSSEWPVSSTAVLIEDSGRLVTYCNPRFREIFSIDAPAEAMIGADCAATAAATAQLFEDPIGFLQRVEELLAARVPSHNERIRLADGTSLERDYIPIVVDEACRGHVWQYRDITPRIRAEQELREGSQAANAANQAKTSFLATVSHEIRTPLTAIIGISELLSDSELSAEQGDLLDSIRANSDFLLSLINDLLDLSKVEAGQIAIESMSFDPIVMFERATLGLHVPAEAKQVDLVLDLDPALPTQVRGDSNRVAQVVRNLVGNAVKFTQSGHVTLRAGFEFDAHNGRLLFDVSDTGIGIPAAMRKRVFERFVQVDASTTRRFGGTGLGLSVVKSLVEAMGGTVGLVSALGIGSTFSVELPLEAPIFGPRAWQELFTGEERLPLLVVGRHAYQTAPLSRVLSYGGGPVEVVRDGGTACALIAEPGRAFSLVLVDEFEASALFEEAALHGTDLPGLIVLGTESSFGAVPLGKNVVGFVPKPVFQRRLLSAVRGYLVPGSGLVAEPAKRDARGARVLVAEDSADLRRLAIVALDRAGFRASSAETGAECLARVKGERFDLVLMDLEMPIMDGIDAARQIRVWERDREAAPTPIVALTAHALDTYREQCHLAGMNGFVTKPLRSEELVEVARTYTKRRSRILIVEDSDDMRMVTRRFLHSAGYEVHVARDGAEGLSMLTCLDPDLVLLDMSMPIMDGYETAAAIRALVGFEKIPILAMTAYVGRQEQTRCLSAGCTAYLAKPVSREQLLDAVNDNLQIDPGSERSVAGTTQFPAAAPLAVSRAHMRSYDPGTSRIPIAIDEDILELVPLFLAEREADVAALEVTLENGSFEAARRIGHQLKGNGGAYGFSWLSELGTALEVAAIAESASDISLAKDYLTRYLSLVEIISE